MSFYATVNGIRADKGTVVFPYYGVWVADLALVSDAPIDGAVTLTLGGQSYVGAVSRSAPFVGIREARIVGGHPVLAGAALDAAKKWKFEPAPGESSGVIDFKFERHAISIEG